MATVASAGNGQMGHVEKLMTLFRAYRERDDVAFQRAADAIIADELAANHHAQARDLQKALASTLDQRPLTRPVNGLSALPKDRRRGESLVDLQRPNPDANRIILAEQSKVQVSRVVEEFAQRHKLARSGVSPKSRLLFWGPPGCGKTLTAHYLALELGLPIATVRLSALVTSYLGETASHMQRIFDMAQTTPMVLLLDEADAIGKERDDRQDIGEIKRVVNSLLQAMDGFRNANSILIAASNHQYLLDSALWRRFDDMVFFPLPDAEQQKAFISKLLNGVTVIGNLDAACKAVGKQSFAQVERNVIEVIKTMILEDRNEIKATELTTQFRFYNQLITTARRKSPSKSSTNE